ncbi:Hypothetical protein ADU73_0582 [Pediococcus damnosus]|uniref:DUF2785 domain-containing protein n=1 Tax=Pediococcus damnosus TaxID=51663 RepID=UPI00078E16E9|nr:DUF2785 domain-containing protein [Pediococcus damnosus]AMV68990.1 Hypothetical protein ADU73_0582 [Pediococcus damnosus]
MKEVESVRTQLQQLRAKLQNGEIYQSLIPEVDNVIKAIKPTAPTKVVLPDDQDGIKDLIENLREQLSAHKLDEISDADLTQLFQHIGSTNLFIRDKGVYFLFSDIIQQQITSKDQLKLIFKHLIQDESLFPHITEPQNDAVFQRSFSVMFLSTLLYVDRAESNFIDDESKNTLVDQMLTYIALETDTRGYAGEKGWAHAYTHIGNVLDELAFDKSLVRADKLLLLAVLITRYKRLATPLIFGEPERLAGYMADLTKQNKLYSDFLLLALKNWRHELVSIQAQENEQMWTSLYNRQRLLQAMVLNPEMPKEITTYLNEEDDFRF